jgi:hypothetical protein
MDWQVLMKFKNLEAMRTMRLMKRKEWVDLMWFRNKCPEKFEEADKEVMDEMEVKMIEIMFFRGLWWACAGLWCWKKFKFAPQQVMVGLVSCYISIPVFAYSSERLSEIEDVQEILIYKYTNIMHRKFL